MRSAHVLIDENQKNSTEITWLFRKANCGAAVCSGGAELSLKSAARRR